MTDYMGSVDPARAWMYRGDNSLIRCLQGNSASWRGFHYMAAPVLLVRYCDHWVWLR
ncbi:hypothetical protein MES5069_520170 [Mesorhizobium escarrei]|uniref:Uncharacterized protein n=1 Tax=Mesorhizobium escarrei TaxID=666018 RepID=A0ABM9EBB1_9HYPH|nr:hypothetical protein MES5069_520170 [Mesorhizobium escarrei]